LKNEQTLVAVGMKHFQALMCATKLLVRKIVVNTLIHGLIYNNRINFLCIHFPKMVVHLGYCYIVPIVYVCS